MKMKEGRFLPLLCFAAGIAVLAGSLYLLLGKADNPSPPPGPEPGKSVSPIPHSEPPPERTTLTPLDQGLQKGQEAETGASPAPSTELLFRSFLRCSNIEDYWELIDRWCLLDPDAAPDILNLLARRSSLDKRERELLFHVVSESLEGILGAEEAADRLCVYFDSRMPRTIEPWFASRAGAALLERYILDTGNSTILLHVPRKRLGGMEFSGPPDPSEKPPARLEARCGFLRYKALKEDPAAVNEIAEAYLAHGSGKGPPLVSYKILERSCWPGLLEVLPVHELDRLLNIFLHDPGRVNLLKLELILDQLIAGRIGRDVAVLSPLMIDIFNMRSDLKKKALAAYIKTAYREGDRTPSDLDDLVERAGGNIGLLKDALLCLNEIDAFSYMAALEKHESDESLAFIWLRQIDAFLAERVETRFLEKPTADKIRILPEALETAAIISGASPAPKKYVYYYSVVHSTLCCYLRSLGGVPREDFGDILPEDRIMEGLELPPPESGFIAAAFIRLLLPLSVLDAKGVKAMFNHPSFLSREGTGLLLLFLKRCAFLDGDDARGLYREYLNVFDSHPSLEVKMASLRNAFRAAGAQEALLDLTDRAIRAGDEHFIEIAFEELPLLYRLGTVKLDFIMNSISRTIEQGTMRQAEECFDILEDSLPKRLDLQDAGRMLAYLEKISNDEETAPRMKRKMGGLIRDVRNRIEKKGENK